MGIEFTKMQGLGNDFVVFDATRRPLTLTPDQIRRIGDRRFGVGCDQILIIAPPTRPDADFLYRIYNADGGEVEQCGNGARAFARYVQDHGLSAKTTPKVETASGIIEPQLLEDGRVRVNMGVPVWDPAAVPFEADARADRYAIEVEGHSYQVGVVSMGNPHVVLRVPDTDSAPVETLGPALESHPRFPKRVNVGFVQHEDRNRIRLRVFERGVGETLACGTGACAAVVTGIVQGALDARVTVALPGGALLIEWSGEGHPVFMTGPAETSFRGEIEL